MFPKKIKLYIFGLIVVLELGSLSESFLTGTECEPFDLEAVITTSYNTNPQLRFYLYTKTNYYEGQLLTDGDTIALRNSNFNLNWPTRIFVPGWKGGHRTCSSGAIKDGYLLNGNYNVIIVDWSDWSLQDYLLACASVREVGYLLASFINFLNINGVAYNDIYLIGHSLGAHVAGLGGRFIAPNKCSTIFGLEPAGPGFQDVLSDVRLSPTDASYVETISTDMFMYGYGGMPQLGHASFYLNNGWRPQPYCVLGTENIPFCNHYSAVLYFANSLNRAIRFCGVRTDWSSIFFKKIPSADFRCQYYMGGDISVYKTGQFYVKVSSYGFFPG